MAGELNSEINQLRIVINNKEDVLKRLKFLLDLAEQVNQGDVTPEIRQMLVDLYVYLTS